MNNIQFPITAGTITGIITILIGILGLVSTFYSAGNYTIPAILALVIGALQVVYAYLTNKVAVSRGLK